MADFGKLDLYGILDVAPDATEKEIVKAYRKKALKWHPDKNPDNPKAAERFHELSKALEALTDKAARAAYDKILKAKEAAKLRHRILDSKRKKFKEDLEAREKSAGEQKLSEHEAAQKLEREIERLRKEGSKLLEQEQERLAQELREQKEREHQAEREDSTEIVRPAFRLKVKWKAAKTDESNGGYDRDSLEEILSKYGNVTALVVSSKKKGTAIVEFDSSHAATLAMQHELGRAENPLTVTWLSGQPPPASEASPTPPGDKSVYQPPPPPPMAAPPMSSNERDFESLVLMRMRQAEERKRLIEQMQKDDDDENT